MILDIILGGLLVVTLGVLILILKHLSDVKHQTKNTGGNTFDSLRKDISRSEREIKEDIRSNQRAINTMLTTRLESVGTSINNHLQSLENNNESKLEQIHETVDKRLRNQLLEPTIVSPFNYQSKWWRDYSWLYRHVQDWQCEECTLPLDSDRQYLHTHHLNGTLYNDPKDLKALCIACHSEQEGPNHKKLTTTEDYHKFMEKYGKQWQLRKSIA